MVVLETVAGKRLQVVRHSERVVKVLVDADIAVNDIEGLANGKMVVGCSDVDDDSAVVRREMVVREVVEVRNIRVVKQVSVVWPVHIVSVAVVIKWVSDD